MEDNIAVDNYRAVEDYRVTLTDTVVMVTTQIMSLFYYIIGEIIL